jgi:hypothetical protein
VEEIPFVSEPKATGMEYQDTTGLFDERLDPAFRDAFSWRYRGLSSTIIVCIVLLSGCTNGSEFSPWV